MKNREIAAELYEAKEDLELARYDLSVVIETLRIAGYDPLAERVEKIRKLTRSAQTRVETAHYGLYNYEE